MAAVIDVFDTIVSSMNLALNSCQASVLQALRGPETYAFLASWNGSLTFQGVGRGAGRDLHLSQPQLSQPMFRGLVKHGLCWLFTLTHSAWDNQGQQPPSLVTSVGMTASSLPSVHFRGQDLFSRFKRA